MKKYEYKTIRIKLEGAGFGKPRKAPGFEETLNSEGAEGWRYVDTIVETIGSSTAVSIQLIFEKEVE